MDEEMTIMGAESTEGAQAAGAEEPTGRVKRKKKGEYSLAYIDIKSEDLCALSVTENKRKPA